MLLVQHRFSLFSAVKFLPPSRIFIDLGIVIFKNKHPRNDLNVLSFYGAMKTLKFEGRRVMTGVIYARHYFFPVAATIVRNTRLHFAQVSLDMLDKIESA